MFKVKATVVGFAGDTHKYPCHFNYKIGDEIIWTGAEFKGRICPGIMLPLAQKVDALYKAGPRYVDPAFYYPFWYAPVSEYSPENKKLDGIGFRNVLKTHVEPQYHMASLSPAHAFTWPPSAERIVNSRVFVQCGDLRTIATLKLEAFDIADDGDAVTYYRRTMVILDKALKNPGTAVDKMLSLYSRFEIEEIYPALSPLMMQILCEELALVGHLEIKDGQVWVTPKGQDKLRSFIDSLPAEDKKALDL